MSINLGVPDDIEPQMKPRITVIGVGGAGGNAVNNMIEARLEGVDFVVANTDAQALAQARTDRRIQLGSETTHGLGSGARPDIGRAAAEESYEAISSEMKGSHMCFITAGMGGGTGTGAAPVVARCARDMGILTVGVVTKPFQFEGTHRMRLADGGIEELAQYVDTLIIIPNQNLFRVANEKTTFADAFKMADNVLYAGVRSVTDLMIMPGLINLDFADVRTVMMDMGRAMMGTGEAGGDNRAIEAAEAAIANPLLEETSMRGARGVLINITGGNDLTLYEVDEAANRIREEIKCEDANVIFGSCLDASLDGTMRVSVVASGIDAVSQARPHDSQEAQGSGFGLGLAAARKVATGGAERTAPPAAREASAATARAADDGVLDDTAADLTHDGLVAPAAALDEDPRAETGAPRPAAQAGGAAAPRPTPGRPAGPTAGSRQPSGHPAGSSSFQARPGTSLPPLQGGAEGNRFIPQRPAQPPAAATARLDPPPAAPTAPAHPGAGGAPVDPGAGGRPHTLGHAEAAPPVRGQTALDPRYHGHEHAAHQGHETRRPTLQPGVRVASHSPHPAHGDPGGRRGEAPHGPRGEEERRDRPSLFQRMTGFGRARGGEEEREPPRRAEPGRATEEPGGAPRAMTVNPEDRPASSHREDQLEIPAFLRRQAN
ncbi:cell division protein FtsZ [Roseospira goensis]|uniref:Cell division protein FtsZ n=1 Tax=Roseospira goensis TaxID=391922 RepID=A0A7W6S0V7_9PROT|nr:cell division protein FtsZ [Roseospira goensis]MBB4286657.1 cell division protein FtsZ [Roseospira goensis]